MKPLKVSLVAAICAVVVFSGAVFYSKSMQKVNIAGRRVFSESYDKLSEKSKIVLSDGHRNYTFFLLDGMWRLEEKDSYYVDFNIMNFFLSTLKNSTVYSYDETENDKFEFVPEWKIDIFYDNKLQDSAMIKKNHEGRYLTKLGNDEEIHQISGYFDFPHSYIMWLKQPLIALDLKEIRSIAIEDKLFYREMPGGKFYSDSGYDEEYLAAAIAEFMNFDFLDVKKYKENNNKKDSIFVVVEMFDGLVYDLEIYKSADKYYTTVRLKTTEAPLIGSREYVKNNSILYEGWIFEIAPEIYTIFSALR